MSSSDCDIKTEPLTDVVTSESYNNPSPIPIVDISTNEVIINKDNPSDENSQKIFQFFVDKGLTEAQAAGFAGNAEQESNSNPKIIQGGAIATEDYILISGRGFGLFQWSNRDRQRGLEKLAKSTGRKITDMSLQLDWAWFELQNGYSGALAKIKTTNTPTDAAVMVHDYYVKSNDSRNKVIVSRGGKAERIFSDQE